MHDLLEFKGDGDTRDVRDKVSGDHAVSAARKKIGKKNYNDYLLRTKDGKGEDVRNMKDKRNHDNMEKACRGALSGKRDHVFKKSVDTVIDASAGKYGEYGTRLIPRMDKLV